MNQYPIDAAELKKEDSEHKWIDAALRESEERYRRLLESITDYIYTVKVESGRPVLTTHSPGCLAVTGYTAEYFQIYPHLWYEMIHEEDRKAVLEQAEKILSGEAVQPLEHRIICKDGSIRWVRNTIVPHHDKEGELIAYDGVIEDITERKMADEALSESEEKFRTIAASAHDAIIMMDDETNISYWNPAAERIFGYSKEVAIGKKLHGLIVPVGHHAGFSEGFKRFQETGVGPVIGKTLELAGIRKDGTEFYAEHSISAVKINGKWNAIGIVRDVSERRMAEAVLKASFTNLERAKRDWEATFDAISDPLFIHDGEFRITRANRAYAEAAGLPFNEIVGRPYYEVFPKMEGPFTVCKEALGTQNTEEEEVSVSAINKIFRMRYYPIRDVDGNYLHSIHIMEDITEQRRAEKSLRDEVDVTTHLLMIAEATAGTSDVDKLMEQVVHCCQKILGCDICLSYLWDKESRVFSPCKAYGLKHGLTPFFMTESMDEKVGFVKEAIKKKEPVIEEVGAVHELPLQWIGDINTIAVIPLIGKKGPLGLIVGVYTKPTLTLHPLPEGEGQFTDRDINVMHGIMHQVSVALEEARLYTDSIDRTMELSHKIETIQVMHEIDRNILSTLEPEEILETVTRMVARIIPCDRATVVLVDREKGGFLYAAGFGVTFVPKGTLVPFSDSSAKDMVETGRTEYVSNLSEVKELLPTERRFLEDGFLSHVRVPLTVKGEVAGILTVGAKRAAAFTQDNLSTLEKLAYQIGVALQNARQLKDLEELFLGTVKSLSSAIDAKSKWTAGHSERVTAYALQIGKEMGVSEKELRDLQLAGLLHDIGKIGTYETILDKPGKLTDEELAIMRQHPAKGAEILSPIKQFKDITPAIRYHQEFYDGTGYPEGLKGEAIPLYARIIGVADTVDALGADRPYRNGKPMDVIIAELKRCSGTQFDPKVVEAFLHIQGG